MVSAVTCHALRPHSRCWVLVGFFHNWLQILDETSPNGAIGCTVPGGAQPGLPANKSCDVSWTTVLPTTAHALMKYEGDLSVGRYWGAITRYSDNLIARASANSACSMKGQQFNWHCGSPPSDGDPKTTCCGITNLFNVFGDWIGEPGTHPWNDTYLKEQGFDNEGTSGQILAGYNFIKDLGYTAEMARWLGKPADAAKYSEAQAKFQEQFHEIYYNETEGCYGSWMLYGCHERACACNQASNSVALLAMEGSALLTPAIRAQVAKFLADDVLAHLNHTTSGIISWKAQLDALARNGYQELAFALMSQKAYPGLGYEVLNKMEPATTVWEQWGAPILSGGMDSRNHPMFAGPADTMYTHFAGLTQAPGSMGFSHVVFSPPPKIIAMAHRNVTLNPNISQPLRLASVQKRTLRGVFSMAWSLPPAQPASYTTCAVRKGGHTIRLGCPNSHMNKIADVIYANYGNAPSNASGVAMGASDDCASVGPLERNGSSTTVGCGFDLSPMLRKACVGHATCHVECGQGDTGYKNCLVNGVLVNTTAAHKFGPGGSCTGQGHVLSAQVACPNPLKTGTTLTIEVTVPPNSRASTRVPLLGASPTHVTIAERGHVLWSNGAFRRGAVAGVTGAALAADDAGVLVVEHGSGRYSFTRVGTE